MKYHELLLFSKRERESHGFCAPLEMLHRSKILGQLLNEMKDGATYAVQLTREELVNSSGASAVEIEATCVPLAAPASPSDRAQVMHDQILELFEEQASLDDVLAVIQAHLDAHASEASDPLRLPTP